MSGDQVNRLGRWFWVGLATGGSLIVIGVAGALMASRETHPPNLLLWFTAVGLSHDALLAPLFIVAALATSRLPVMARSPVRVGLAGSFMLTLVTWPVVREYGRSPSVPSLLPLDYERNLFLVLGGIWLLVLVTVAYRWSAARGRRPKT